MCKPLDKPEQLRQLRNTLGHFPTGVAIVTAHKNDGSPIGMTINSFTSISLTPPLVAWSLDRSAVGYRHYANTSAFTITVLSEEQVDLARRFATRGANKFKGVVEAGDGKPPAIAGGVAVFECTTYRTISLGDHLMIVGQVDHFEHGTDSPLLFIKGNFHELENGTPLAA